MTLTKEAREFFATQGRKGAELTNKKLSPAQRKKNARKAIAARWSKVKKAEKSV